MNVYNFHCQNGFQILLFFLICIYIKTGMNVSFPDKMDFFYFCTISTVINVHISNIKYVFDYLCQYIKHSFQQT